MRERISISLDPKILEWANTQVEKHIEYRDRSHLIEIALNQFKEQLEKVS